MRVVWISAAVVAAVVLIGAATLGGYGLGRVRAAAQQPPANTVTTPFVHFRLVSGWTLSGRTSTEVKLAGVPNGSMSVQAGNARRAGVASDADLLEQALYGVTQNHLQGSVGSCLPVTQVNVGGRAGEEVGFLYRELGPDGTSTVQNCEFVWVDVQGSRFFSWSAVAPTRQLPRLVRTMRAMQRTAVWTT